MTGAEFDNQQRIRGQWQEAGSGGNPVALDDDTAGTILHVAEDGEDAEGAGVPGRCDLIAMATHGHSGFQHWVLGSVTERVLGATRLPLLIVRPPETEFHRAGNGSAAFAAVEMVG